MVILIIILYFLVTFISYYFLVKRHIFKHKNRENTEMYQIACLIWPISILVYICVSPFILMEKIDKYIFEKNYNKL